MDGETKPVSGNHLLLSVYTQSQGRSFEGVQTQARVSGLRILWPDIPVIELVTEEDMRIDSFWPIQRLFPFYKTCISVPWLIWLTGPDRRLFKADHQWAQQETNQVSGICPQQNNPSKLHRNKKRRKKCKRLKYLTCMCWRVNIAIWMDPLNKEYQTNSETITNILYKAPHGYTVHS